MTEPDATGPKPDTFHVEVTVKAGMPVTPQTFSLRVASIEGMEISPASSEDNMPLVLVRQVNVGDNEFYRWIDEGWEADLTITMNEIRFLVQDATATYLYYGTLGKTENKGLKESLCLSVGKITPAYRA